MTILVFILAYQLLAYFYDVVVENMMVKRFCLIHSQSFSLLKPCNNITDLLLIGMP